MRETKAAKTSRISMLLADYDDKNRQLRKLQKDVDDLKKQIADIPVGTYGDWVRGEGTPRELLDQQEAKRLLTEAGIPVPVKSTAPPVTVNPAIR
jgi:hypothetical protein